MTHGLIGDTARTAIRRLITGTRGFGGRPGREPDVIAGVTGLEVLIMSINPPCALRKPAGPVFRPGSGPGGPLVPSDSADGHGTCPTLVRLTCMKNQFKSQHSRARTKTSGGKPTCTTRLTRLSTHDNPAREFLISLGWLRLFQAIVFKRCVLPEPSPCLHET